MRQDAIRGEVAVEEVEASEAEAVEKSATLDVPMHLRIDTDLDAKLCVSGHKVKVSRHQRWSVGCCAKQSNKARASCPKLVSRALPAASLEKNCEVTERLIRPVTPTRPGKRSSAGDYSRFGGLIHLIGIGGRR